MSYTGSVAILGKGSTLAWSATSAGTFVAFHEATKISSPKPTGKDVDVTNLDSGAYEEFIEGLLSAGEVDAEQNYNKADMVTLYSLLGVKTYFKHTLPDGSVFAYAGFVKEPTLETQANDKISTKFKIKITGAATFTAGA